MTPLEVAALTAAVLLFAKDAAERFYYERRRSEDNARWTKVLNELSTAHASDLQQLVAVRSGHLPASMVPPAIVTEHADPEIRMGRQIREDTVQAGMQRLGDMYRESGIAMPPEAELRRQAENALDGRPLV